MGKQTPERAAPTSNTFLLASLLAPDHFSEIGLSKDLGYSEHHEGIFWTDQVCSKSSVQKSHKQLGIHEQIFLNEGS
ncbi:hypothetical protein Nmel_015598, partial [Mimus melanotis]